MLINGGHRANSKVQQWDRITVELGKDLTPLLCRKIAVVCSTTACIMPLLIKEIEPGSVGKKGSGPICTILYVLREIELESGGKFGHKGSYH